MPQIAVQKSLIKNITDLCPNEEFRNQKNQFTKERPMNNR